jgi:2'-5' RNA ligase
MSTNLVIVAIPEENDRIWDVSSEKVPHLTLLHLGDVTQIDNLEQIVQFVEHAVTLSEHGQFYLDVDHRGTLGEQDADVLFFSTRSWNLKWIRQFRGQLLQNAQIKTAFDAADQINEAPQEWLPHLTLGYPQAPAKPLGPKDGFNHTIYSVCFDRIAVWTEDFNGPEFRLQWPDRELEGDLAIAYSDTQKMALTHCSMNGLDLKHHWTKLGSKETEIEADATPSGEEFVKDLMHQSVLDNPTLADQIKAKVQSILDDVTGDADNDISLFGDPLIRTKIQSVLQDFYKDPNVDNAVVYDALGEVFIEHFGIKGMRWGRSPGGRAVGGQPQGGVQGPAGNRAQDQDRGQGWREPPAHEDAVKVAEAKAKLKKSRRCGAVEPGAP